MLHNESTGLASPARVKWLSFASALMAPGIFGKPHTLGKPGSLAIHPSSCAWRVLTLMLRCAWQGGAHAAGGGHLVRHGRGRHSGAGPLLPAVEPGDRRAP